MNIQPLRGLADAAATARDVGDLLEEVVQAGPALMGADRAAVLILDEGGVLRFRAWRRLSERYRGSAGPRAPWPPEQIDAQPILVADVQTEPSLEPERAAMQAEGIRALALVPVVAEQRVIGAFAAYYDASRAFSDEESQIARFVARQVALGFDRLRTAAAIGELRELERAARREAEAARHAVETANAARSELLSILGHEMRNPLNAIVNAAQVLGTETAPATLKSVAHGILRRQVTHLAGLLDALLEETRLGRGLIELRLESLDVRDVVRLAAEALAPRVEAKALDLRLSLPDHPVAVTGDPGRLRQAIGNLLDNAVKYTPARGSIRLDLSADPDGVRLRIRDTGIGIPADQLTAIFQPFAQGPQDLSRSDGGLGLGLSLVKRIVELHGGHVRAESPGPAAGAKFTVYIPRVPPPRPSPPPD